MTKEDLKYGNVIELRNGRLYLYSNCEDWLIKLDGSKYMCIHNYDDNLNLDVPEITNGSLDIMRIYKDYTCKEVLWERKEKQILTDVERIILENIDKNYKWIARDKNGRLYIHQNKPFKYSEFWSDDNCRRDFPFDNLFQFIQWEDEEPYSIEELLKENN